MSMSRRRGHSPSTRLGGAPSSLAFLLPLLLLCSASSFLSLVRRAAVTRHHVHRRGPSSSSSSLSRGGSSSALPLPPLGAARDARIPSSPSDRDATAITSIRAALSKPRLSSYPLVECEFPSLSALNKLGDGSLRSSLEAEGANVDFVIKLVRGLSYPVLSNVFGPRVCVITSTSASDSLVERVRRGLGMGGGGGGEVYSLKGGAGSVMPLEGDGTTKSGRGGREVICVFLTPSSQGDYRTARSLADMGRSVVIVNGSFKDLKTIPGSATMAYYLKPLTYNSQVAGYLIRSYPGPWTVLDGTNTVLGTYDDDRILVEGTNTPDLRGSGRLVQRSVDERAIRERERSSSGGRVGMIDACERRR